MVASRKDAEPKRPKRPPATTPESREVQMVSLAVTLAEKQLEDGTASAAVITHYLKLATTRERLEQEKLARENELLRAKVDNLGTAKNIEKLYEDAITAMRTYAGQEIDVDDDY